MPNTSNKNRGKRHKMGEKKNPFKTSPKAIWEKGGIKTTSNRECDPRESHLRDGTSKWETEKSIASNMHTNQPGI